MVSRADPDAFENTVSAALDVDQEDIDRLNFNYYSVIDFNRV